MRGPRHWGKRGWLFAGLGTIAFVAIAIPLGTWIYIHWIEGPPPKKLALTSQTAPPSVPAAGDWTVGPDSQVGYRVKEILFGQSTEAVGRTAEVTGSMTVSDTAVTAASFTAQMASVHSDQGNRDGQFRGRIMDVDKHPTSTFTLTKPIDLGTLPAGAQTRTYSATGDVTLRGTTRSVTFDLTAQRTGAIIAVTGQIPIHFADYGIPNPSAGPASVGDDGTLEVLLRFSPR